MRYVACGCRSFNYRSGLCALALSRNTYNRKRISPMFTLRQPSRRRIERFLAAQRDRPFSYAAVGASRAQPPAGYTLDHNRIQLGAGSATFAQAVAALRRWDMFRLGWVRLCWPAAPLA